MDPISRLAAEPAKAALFLDVDGVLAPIVPRPEDARVPDETRVELGRLHARHFGAGSARRPSAITGSSSPTKQQSGPSGSNDSLRR